MFLSLVEMSHHITSSKPMQKEYIYLNQRKTINWRVNLVNSTDYQTFTPPLSFWLEITSDRGGPDQPFVIELVILILSGILEYM